MLIRVSGRKLSLAPGETCVFGRGADVDLTLVVGEGDLTVSRRAGRLTFGRYAWELANIGRRPFYLVAAGTEIELTPESDAVTTPVVHPDSWIRLPTIAGDLAIELDVPADERPVAVAAPADGGTAATETEGRVTITDNELLSVLAVYESYLSLPPAYRREPRSFRAAAHRLGVEEGKVKADLRRVQHKVDRAGGPADGGSRHRDALISWLLARQVVRRADIARLSGNTVPLDRR